MLTAQRLASISITGCIFCLAIGCGGPDDEPELGTVSGVVTMEGKPLSGVWIGFAPELGRSSMGMTDKEGRYELNYLPEKKGAKVGKHKVAITTPSEDEFGGQVRNFRERIPARYNSLSSLTADVKSGHNDIDFKLEKGTSARK